MTPPLLFGPYATPPFRDGDAVIDEARGEVVVCGLSAATPRLRTAATLRPVRAAASSVGSVNSASSSAVQSGPPLGGRVPSRRCVPRPPPPT